MGSSRGKGVILNRSEVADHFGVVLTTVDAWVRSGCPVVQRGKQGVAWAFNSAAVAAWREQRIRDEMTGTTDASADELKRRKMAAETALAELDLAMRRGDVAMVAEFEAATTALCAGVRSAMRSIPPRCASKIGTVRDERQVAAIIMAEVDRALNDLADANLVTEAHLDPARTEDAPEEA